MTRLLRYLTGPRPYHRRNWRRLWRYCRCGWRWRCPDSVELVPTPYQPPPPPRLTERERAEIRALSAPPPPVTPDPPLPPARLRASNRGRGWDPLTPARRYPTRPGTRV